ncbi:MAG: sigma-70 family RNA polymerase sigma factor, partial [Verrucomicrobia bacterium]|nr:sigma-70 family RNA polymerase sigma factor [Verrucomicrobiota bacterium]
MKDSELLHAWAKRHDHDAFGELVRRHLNLVHASARRQVGDPELAEEVAQAVFLVLARRAASLGDRVVLSGWLFRTTRFVATRALRTRQRRTHHETLAAMTPANAEPAATPDAWTEVAPHLDAALAALPGADRDAVLLRYVEGRPLRAVGEQLGISEDAAKKRVSRALERLRSWLARRGVALTAGGLATLLTEMPSEAATAGLAARIAGAVSGSTAEGSALALASGAARDALLDRVRALLPWSAVAVLLIGVGLWLGVTRTSTPSSSGLAAALGATTETTEAAAVSQVPKPDPALPARPGPSKVLLSVRSARDNRPLVASVLASLSGQREHLEDREYQTDVEGTLEVPVSDPRIRSLVLFISASGHVPVKASWTHHEFVDPVLLHQTVLQPGQVLEGVVRDEEGRPIPDAQVRLRGSGMDWMAREYTAFHPRLSGVTTDAIGRFRTDQIPPLRGHQAGMSYVVEHPDFAKSRVWMPGPASLETNHVVVLQQGTSFTGRVVGPDDVPVAGARLVERDPYGGSGRETVSGPDGDFTFGPFEGTRVEVEITADGFQPANEKLAPAIRTNEIVVRLQAADGSITPGEQTMDQAPTVRIVGSVVDAESGAPIPIFRVRMTEDGGVIQSVIGDGHQGRFDWPVEMAFVRKFSLEVDADGHAAALSDVRPASAGTQTFDFRLERGGSIRSSVRDAAGRPVAGAVVGINGPGFSFIVRDNQTFSGNGALPV